MKLIKRNYLDKLIDVMDTPDIKVITGVRRSGKSKLLEMFQDYIIKTTPTSNIIFINFNLSEYEPLNNYKSLNEYIENKYQKNKKNYLLIDEVQMCESFEKTINSLHAKELYDIYITGSNAFLLSSDLKTLFTGRTYEIEIFPFSYQEFLNYYNLQNTEESFERYTLEGGFSGSYLYKKIEDKYNYIESIVKTLIIRDIIERYNIKNISLMESLCDFLMDNISNLTSYRNISNMLNKNSLETNDKTIASYVKYLTDSFLFYRIRRYDIQGKKYLANQDKYYLVDHAMKLAKLGIKNMNYGRIYENIVAIELLKRGYEVYVGTLYEQEIDFVAIKRNEKIYIQVSDDITKEETLKREVTPLLKIKDAYPKLLITRSKHDSYSYEGVQILNIKDWLIK